MKLERSSEQHFRPRSEVSKPGRKMDIDRQTKYVIKTTKKSTGQ